MNLHPPMVLFGAFCLYGLSGYAVYAWRKTKGKPVSVIAISTDEPDERGLAQLDVAGLLARRAILHSMSIRRPAISLLLLGVLRAR